MKLNRGDFASSSSDSGTKNTISGAIADAITRKSKQNASARNAAMKRQKAVDSVQIRGGLKEGFKKLDGIQREAYKEANKDRKRQKMFKDVNKTLRTGFRAWGAANKAKASVQNSAKTVNAVNKTRAEDYQRFYEDNIRAQNAPMYNLYSDHSEKEVATIDADAYKELYDKVYKDAHSEYLKRRSNRNKKLLLGTAALAGLGAGGAALYGKGIEKGVNMMSNVTDHLKDLFGDYGDYSEKEGDSSSRKETLDKIQKKIESTDKIGPYEKAALLNRVDEAYPHFDTTPAVMGALAGAALTKGANYVSFGGTKALLKHTLSKTPLKDKVPYIVPIALAGAAGGVALDKWNKKRDAKALEEYINKITEGDQSSGNRAAYNRYVYDLVESGKMTEDDETESIERRRERYRSNARKLRGVQTGSSLLGAGLVMGSAPIFMNEKLPLAGKLAYGGTLAGAGLGVQALGNVLYDRATTKASENAYKEELAHLRDKYSDHSEDDDIMDQCISQEFSESEDAFDSLF